MMRSRSRRSAIVNITTVLFACAIIRLSAQQLPDEPGVWKPWKPITAIASARADRGAAAADVKAFEATMLELNAIVKRAPAVVTPIGYSVETWANLNGYRPDAPNGPSGKLLPLAGGFTFGAFPIFQYERNGRMIREDRGETELLQFQVNELGAWLIGESRPPEWSSIGETDVFLQPLPRGEVAGIARFGDLGVIKKNPASLWMPASLQDVLSETLRTREYDLKGLNESMTRLTASLDEWRTPAKRAERQKGYQQSAAYMPDGARWLQGVPKMEQEIEAHMAAEVAPGSSLARSIAEQQAAIAAIKTYLTDLSPEHRQAQGCYAKDGKELRTKFRSVPPTGSTPECQGFARANLAFFNRSLPRTAPQVIVIPQFGRCMDRPARPNAGPAGCSANRRLLETLDMQAVLDWLK